MSTSHQLTVTLLGPDIDHKKSLEAMLEGRVKKVSWTPDSVSSTTKERPGSIAKRIEKAYGRLTYTRDKDFLERTCAHLDENGTDVVIGYWGTMPLPDLMAIKHFRPMIKTVLMVLCFPLAFDDFGVQRQHWRMRHAASKLDGILFPGSVMQKYFQKKVFGKRSRQPSQVVIKPCWPQSYQQTDVQFQPSLDTPNLIFVGRTDLSSPTIQVADDLRPLMKETLENEIELHHVRSPETNDGHPYRRLFEPLKPWELMSKMRAHDASLIAYNADGCQNADRLDLTVPDRLISSVAAGVPIAIPRKGYSAAKQYMAEYPAVLEFGSASELKQMLADRMSVDTLRSAARDACKLYSAENQGDTLAQFLVSLTGMTA